MIISARTKQWKNLCFSCKFPSLHALLADLYGEIEYLQQSDKSPSHIFVLSFITYHKMNRSNQGRAQIAGE